MKLNMTFLNDGISIDLLAPEKNLKNLMTHGRGKDEYLVPYHSK